MTDPDSLPITIDPRAIERLGPFIATAVEGQPDAFGVRAAIDVYGIAVSITRDASPTVIVSLFDNSGGPHELCRVRADLVGLHVVDGHVLYLRDPILDA